MLETSTPYVNPQPTLQATIARAQASGESSRQGMTEEKARQAAQEFESIYLNTMLSSMFNGISAEAPFGGGHAEEQYRGLLLEEYGKSIAQSGGVGIADSVYRELLAIQEGSQ